MKYSRAASGEERKLSRLGFALLAVSSALLLGCEELLLLPQHTEDTNTREPTLIFHVDPDIVFVAAGQQARVQLGATPATDDVGFGTVALDASGTNAATGPADTTISIEYHPVRGFSAPVNRALLRIQTGAATTPGVYRIPLRLSRSLVGSEPVHRFRDLTLVVVPDAAAPPGPAVAAMSAGDAHNLAVLVDGSVWAWGRNHRGQLGDGTLIDRAVPVPVIGLPRPAVAVAAGAAHSLALLDDGSVFGWGDNEESQLIDDRMPGHDFLQPSPIRLRRWMQTRIVDVADIVAIAAGTAHSIAIEASGRVLALGRNEHGALGALWSSNAIQTHVVDLPVAVIDAAAGDGYTIALADDGSVWAWGRSHSGQLGAAVGNPSQFTPIDVAFVPPVVGIGVGSAHTLLILDDGNVGGLGDNTSGQLGDGSLDTPPVQPTIPPFLDQVVEVDGGWLHSLARQADRTVHAWGNNDFGQVSDASTALPDGLGRLLQRVPVQVTGVPPSAAVSAGGRHSLSFDDYCGQLWSWGDNGFAQLGDGTVLAPGGSSATPMPVYGLGEAGLPGGCPVLVDVATQGPGQVSVVGSGPLIDACTGACTARVGVGTTVTVSAQSDADARFLGWGGSCTGTATDFALLLDRSRSCVARFNGMPTADFTIHPNPAELDSGFIDFDASSSRDDGLIVSFEWDMDDDGVFDLTGLTAVLSSPPSGSHPVRLRVTDDDGDTDEIVHILTVASLATASFTYSPPSPVAGQWVSFDATASTASGGITAYEWDFDGDGNPDATGATTTHAFPTAGTHPVQLRVTATGALPGTLVQDVVVAPVAGGDAVLSLENLGAGAGVVSSTDATFVCSFDGAASAPSPCSRAFASGTTIHLTPMVAPGSFFSHWGIGDCDAETLVEGLVQCSVTVQGATSVRVYFE